MDSVPETMETAHAFNTIVSITFEFIHRIDIMLLNYK